MAPVKFSVVVTAYNYATLLPDALRALAAQTVQDFELLIVDDGSTDNTEEVVEQFRPRFRNLHYLKKTNGGPADSRNYGVERAGGTHVAILDADDIWSPRYLEVVRDQFDSSPRTELLFTDGLRIRDNGEVIRPVFPPQLPALDGHINSVGSLFAVCSHFLPSGMVFAKSLYHHMGGFDTRFLHGDDVDWVVRAALAGAYCVRVDQKLFLYRFHGRNLTNNPIAFLDTWLRIYKEQMKDNRLGPECERRARSFARNYVLRLLGICSAAKGRSLLASALKALQGDFTLRCVYFSTFLGSPYALRPLKWGKHLLRKPRAHTQKVDLTASSEIIFQSL